MGKPNYVGTLKISKVSHTTKSFDFMKESDSSDWAVRPALMKQKIIRG